MERIATLASTGAVQREEPVAHLERGAVADLLREKLQALQRDESLRVTRDPAETLVNLRQEVVRQADAVGLDITVTVLPDESGWIVRRADHTDVADMPTVHTGEPTGPEPREPGRRNLG